jgi:hypothetical protein
MSIAGIRITKSGTILAADDAWQCEFTLSPDEMRLFAYMLLKTAEKFEFISLTGGPNLLASTLAQGCA